MRAKDAMSKGVVTISHKATVFEAAKLMLDRSISGLPVVDDDGRLVGIVTDGDLLIVPRSGLNSMPRRGARARTATLNSSANISSRTAAASVTS